jgi:hypothetical protein
LLVSTQVAARFSTGLAAGLDPDGAAGTELPAKGEPQHIITSLRSRWLHRLCPICGHTFRPGDEVLAVPDGPVVHNLPGLRCRGGHPEAASNHARAQAFFVGLAEAWPLPVDVPLVRLEGDHWLLAPPRAGFRRPTCRVCGHSFRPLDHVVICPCDPVNPRCRVAVHRDLFRQMHCYDQWAQGKSRYCLAF